MRSTVSEMGPVLLGRLLGLNEVQSGVLQIVFKYADDQKSAVARPQRPPVDAAIRGGERQVGHD